MEHDVTDTIGSLAVETFRSLHERIAKYGRKAKEEDDPEHIHQLRVHLRKLRAAIALFDHVINLPKELTDKKIARVARSFGKKRDNDVLTEKFNEMTKGAAADDQLMIDTATKAFAKEGKKATKSIGKALRGKGFDNINEALESWIKDPKLRGESLPDDHIDTLLQPAAKEVGSHEGWKIIQGLNVETKIERLFSETGDTVHDLRKSAKRWRYQMEFAASINETDFKKKIQAIKFLQDHLGAIQDMRILKEFLDTVLDSGWPLWLPSAFETIVSKMRGEVVALQKNSEVFRLLTIRM